MKLCKLSAYIVLLALLGCRSSTQQGPPDGADAVVIQLNWYPESEHGGVFQGFAEGRYQAEGIDLQIQPGGANTPIGPELVLGRTQFAIANADDVVLFREQGMDIVAVMAAMQNHPRCVLARKDSGITGFDDLAGKTFQRNPGRAFVEFMRSKGILDGVKEVPYHGSIANLLADPNTVIQAYSCAEPLLASQQGVEVTTLMLSDLGFNPYSSVLVTTGQMIREQPDLVRRFVAVTRDGWRNYLADGSKGNAAILKVNDAGMTAEALGFGASVMHGLAMPEGPGPESLGAMTAERWSALLDQLKDLKLVDADKVKAEDCYTLEFL